MLLRFAAAFLVLTTATAALPDVVHLKNGGKVEGEVVDRGDVLEVRSLHGMVQVLRDQVARIEKKEYVPPARPRGDEAPPAPEMGERFREPFLGLEIRVPYGWAAGPPSRGSIFTFLGPSRRGYRAKIDVLSKNSPATPEEFQADRRAEFAGTFPGARITDEPPFAAGELTFAAFAAELSSDKLALHAFQATAAQGERHLVLSLVCEAAERDLARAEAARAFASFRLVEPVTRDRDLADRFRDRMATATEAYRKGDTEGALAGFRDAADLLPAHPMPWQNLGLICASRNRMDESAAAYRKLVELLPDSATAWANLAAVYRTMGKYEDARAAYEKVLTLDPRHADSFVNLSAIYQMKGDTGTAVRCARTATLIQPDHVSAHFNLAQLLNLQGKEDEAIREYRRVLELEPGHKLAREEIERLER